jgi:hypothetical protein
MKNSQHSTIVRKPDTFIQHQQDEEIEERNIICPIRPFAYPRDYSWKTIKEKNLKTKNQ